MDAGAAFRPPWWCRHRHLQTVWGPLFRRGRLQLQRERFITRDGDFVDLDWFPALPDASPAAAVDPRAPEAGARVPLVLVLHGLEGSSRSHYVTGVLREAAALGWRGVVLNFRSCSGELNRLPRFYHSGDTGDLDAVVEHLVAREPACVLGAVGISLGGNVLLKWLGERGASAPPALRAAVAVSVPYDLVACARTMDRGFQRAVYTARFLQTMRQKVREKARRYPHFVDVQAVRRARTFAEYDRAMTAPVHGFRDEMDYWRRASSLPYLAAIRRPSLLISSLDDPFVPADSLPDARTLPADVRLEIVGRGGHAGFIEGRWPWRVGSWAERRALEFLAARLAGLAGGQAPTGSRDAAARAHAGQPRSAPGLGRRQNLG